MKNKIMEAKTYTQKVNDSRKKMVMFNLLKKKQT